MRDKCCSCAAFADRGERIVIADIDEAGGQARASEIGDAARFVRCDMSSVDDADSVVATAVSEFGRLDHLFNNAGLANMSTTPETETRDRLRVIDITLNSVFCFHSCAFSRVGLPEMRGHAKRKMRS